MIKSQLYTNLVAATGQVIAQFGKTIIQEDRFVNILSDMYPDRDNPAVTRIIKSAIQDGILIDITSATIKNIETVIANATVSLTKKYGYEPLLTEGILYSISVGSDVISKADYMSLCQKKKVQSKKNTSNNSQTNSQNSNNQNPSQNNKKQNSRNKNTNKKSGKYTAFLIWGIIGLSISPFIYANLICKSEWWPMPTTIVIALLHLVTIVPAAVSFGSASKNKDDYPFTKGGFCALMILAIIFWGVFPFFWASDDVEEYFGFEKAKESIPLILTIMLNFICAGFLGVGLSETVGMLSGNSNNNNNFWKNLGSLFETKSFAYGFLFISTYFLVIGISTCVPSIIRDKQAKQEIENLRIQINDINHQKDSLKIERSKTVRNLAFADFSLGSGYEECLSIIKSKQDYSLSSKSYRESYYNLTINDTDYNSIVDKYITFKTNWNNEEITIVLFFSHAKLLAIILNPQITDGNSIVTMYTDKYGVPEYYLSDYMLSNDYYVEYKLKNEGIEGIKEVILKPSNYYWTFKNSKLEINILNSYEGSATIIYFDRIAEQYLIEKNKEEERQKKIEAKRTRDSINQARKEQELIQRRQKEQEEKNHQKSINQI